MCVREWEREWRVGEVPLVVPSAPSECSTLPTRLHVRASPCRCQQAATERSRKDLGRFLSEMNERGWKVRTFLLSTSEKSRYVYMPGSASSSSRGKA